MRRATIRARHGARADLAGTLTDLNGTPIAGAQVGVSSRLKLRDSSFTPQPIAVTDALGRFSEATAEVVVAAPVRLAASPSSTRNGRTVRFGGRVLGTTASGPRVELQAWADGKWIPFRTVALVKGRFNARYRFTNTSRTTRYRFRAVVRSDPKLPYTAGRSSVVSVLVRA